MLSCVLAVLISLLPGSLGSTQDQRLREHLFQNYNYFSTPSDDLIEYGIQFSVDQVLGEVKSENRFSLRVHLRFCYFDSRFQWDPQDYGGISYIVSLHNNEDGFQYFTPEPLIEQGFSGIHFTELTRDEVNIFNTGYFYFSWVGKMDLRSSFQIEEYPFDSQVQNINIFLASQGDVKQRLKQMRLPKYNKPDTVFATSLIKTKKLLDNVNWEVVSISDEITTIQRMGREVPVMKVKFKITRRAMTVFNIMLYPGFLLQIQSLNTFFIRINDNLRIQFCISTLLALILFQVMITKFLPINDQISVLSEIFNSLVVVVFCTMTFILINRHYFQYFQKRQDQYEKKQQKLRFKLYKQAYKKLKRKYKKNKEKKEGLDQPLDTQQQELVRDGYKKLDFSQALPLEMSIIGHSNRQTELAIDSVRMKQDEGAVQEEKPLVGAKRKTSKALMNGLHSFRITLLYKLPKYLDMLFFIIFTITFFIMQAENIMKIKVLKQSIAEE